MFRSIAAAIRPRCLVLGLRFASGSSEARLHGAVCLERLPMILEEQPQWEKDFEQMHREVFNKYAKQYPKGFLSDAPARAAQDPDVRSWQPKPRVTPADEKNDRKSLMRKLDRRLYLIVNTPKSGWQFPQVEHKAGENMMQTAERALTTFCKPSNQDVYFVSNAPCGVQRLPVRADPATDKVFYFRAQHLFGGFELVTARARDYVWVTREELTEYMDPDTAVFMQKLLWHY